MAALKHLRTWAEETYHPWLLDEILLPLAGLTRSALPNPSGAGLAQDDEDEEEEEEHESMETGSKPNACGGHSDIPQKKINRMRPDATILITCVDQEFQQSLSGCQ